ncbi:lysophospholipid acyltransferase family protein [Treponema primitia]|uniref:lysophospholipid acyltransferase family protein n=1 Tax=Treponema primitia TaxID=88058 RepID=UPI001E5290DD|nr:lysophospholipid acyltransferase family protein [Treponema primitia]
MFLLGRLGFKQTMDYLAYKMAQGWAHVILAFTGCKLTVTGRENIPRKDGFCLVGNHNSIFDIVLLLATVGRPFGFIAKKELAVIPLLNLWILLLGGLFIDRKNIRKAIGTINEGIRRIKAGGAMIIFPEGTRGKGRGLLPFKSGSLKLATKAGAPMVPLAITGSYDVFEKTYRLHSGPVSVNFAPPIATADISTEDKRGGSLTDQVYGIIDGMLKKAEGTAP